jgi:hypothetical protein
VDKRKIIRTIANGRVDPNGNFASAQVNKVNPEGMEMVRGD